MNRENFTPIKDFEGLYSINKKGEVLSLRAGIILAQSINTYGYKQVALFKKGVPRVSMVHRLLAETFIPIIKGFDCVNHKDGNKHNNDLENLEWCTKCFNNRHAREMGLHRGGGFKKPVLRISGTEIVRYESAVEAKKDGFNPSSISACINGRKKMYKNHVWKLAS